jgi:nitrate/nitrite transporter NarK
VAVRRNVELTSNTADYLRPLQKASFGATVQTTGCRENVQFCTYFGNHEKTQSLNRLELSEAAAAATFGLINSIGQLGGFAGNYAIGLLKDRTYSLAASFAFIALVYVAAGGLILS